MHLVLDANEYIFGFGNSRKPSCERLLDEIAAKPDKHFVSICRPTLEEIGRHLLPRQLGEVHALFADLGVEIDERWAIPFECVERYIAKGLKRGDAFLAGYTEWVGADCLISENRKDLVDHPELFPFKVRTAEQFLREPRKNTTAPRGPRLRARASPRP